MTPARVLVALALLAAVSAGCGRYLAADAAVVNGERITRVELERRLEALLATREGQDASAVARAILGDLVREALVLQEARHRGIAVAAEDVDRELEAIRSRFESPEAFEEAVRREGLDSASLRGRVEDSLVAFRLRNTLAPAVTDAEVEAEYRRQKDRFEQIRIRHILFAVAEGEDPARAEAGARSALAEIRGGASFADLARRRSEDPGSAPSGGDLGFVSRGTLVPEFERAAFGLLVGEISDPVRTAFGFHLITVEERRLTAAGEARDTLREELTAAGADEAFAEWLDAALATAAVEVNPRYGSWNAEMAGIAPLRFFVPAVGGGREPEPAAAP